MVVHILQSIGLSEKEAKVYSSLLELGTASVLAISKKAELKRPTTYLVLDVLQRKGLVCLVPNVKSSLFTAESPEYLAKDIRKKDELLKRFLPELLAIHNLKKERPQVQLFQGKAGVLAVYEKIYTAGEVDFFATLGQLEKVLPLVTKTVSHLSGERRLKIREILSGTDADLKYARQIKQTEYYKIRLAQGTTGFLTDNAIFGSSLAFFSFSVQMFAVVITSREISGSVKSLFEMAWAQAAKFK